MAQYKLIQSNTSQTNSDPTLSAATGSGVMQNRGPGGTNPANTITSNQNPNVPQNRGPGGTNPANTITSNQNPSIYKNVGQTLASTLNNAVTSQNTAAKTNATTANNSLSSILGQLSGITGQSTNQSNQLSGITGQPSNQLSSATGQIGTTISPFYKPTVSDWMDVDGKKMRQVSDGTRGVAYYVDEQGNWYSKTSTMNAQLNPITMPSWAKDLYIEGVQSGLQNYPMTFDATKWAALWQQQNPGKQLPSNAELYQWTVDNGYYSPTTMENQPNFDYWTTLNAYRTAIGDQTATASMDQLYSWAVDNGYYTPAFEYNFDDNTSLSSMLSYLLQNADESGITGTDAASIWMANILSQFPNVANAYTDQANTAIQNINNYLGLNQQVLGNMNDSYNNLYQNADSDYSNLYGNMGSDYDNLRSQLQNYLGTIGSDFANYNSYLTGQTDASQNDMQALYDQMNTLYGGLQENQTGYIWDTIQNAMNSVTTGALPTATQSNIDSVYQSQADLLKKEMNEYLSSEQSNLRDQMAGRGILSSGVTGKAWGDISETATSDLESGLSKLLTQRSQSMMEEPYKQLEAALSMNDYTTTAANLTTSQASALTEMLMDKYQMTKDEADNMLNALTAKHSAYNTGYSNLANATDSQYSNMLGTLNGQYDVLGNTLSNQFQQELSAIAQGLSGSTLTTDMLATMFDKYGSLSQNFLTQILQKYITDQNNETELYKINTEASIAQAQQDANEQAGILGALGAIMGGGDACVDENTLILMKSHQYKPAKEVRIGDEVVMYNKQHNMFTSGTVDYVTRNKFEKCYTMQYADGTTITVTAFHPFLIQKGNKRKWASTHYWYGIRKAAKRLISEPYNFFETMKWFKNAIKDHCQLAIGQEVCKYGIATTKLIKIVPESTNSYFYNFTIRDTFGRINESSFIGNDIVLQGLNDWTNEFITWIKDSGNYPQGSD